MEQIHGKQDEWKLPAECIRAHLEEPIPRVMHFLMALSALGCPIFDSISVFTETGAASGFRMLWTTTYNVEIIVEERYPAYIPVERATYYWTAELLKDRIMSTKAGQGSAWLLRMIAPPLSTTG
jgi:hypothetical protein